MEFAAINEGKEPVLRMPKGPLPPIVGLRVAECVCFFDRDPAMEDGGV